MKHVDWNSPLTTRRGKLFRDYADRNSCLIFGPDTPTTIPYKPFATPDVLDIVITKNVQFPVYLTWCSALSSDHLPVLIDTAGRTYFHRPSYRADFRSTYWAKFQNYLEDQVPFDTDLHNEMLSICALRAPAPFLELWRYQLPSVARVKTHGLR
jgi:hypothetical protein